MLTADVFLGGTCAESTWREELMPLLDRYNITYFNPVVDDWTEECQLTENWHKENDKFNLFVITKEMKGVFSIAEVVDLSNKRPTSTIFCVLYDGFDKGQTKSLKATEALVKSNGGLIAKDIQDIAYILNKKINMNDDIFEYNNVIEVRPDTDQNVPFDYDKTIFLAGTIDMGHSENWQQKVIKFLDDHNKKCVVFNPRRLTWPGNNTEEFNKQVNWELTCLETADYILMNILGDSKSPISLLELGLFAKSKKLTVICEENYYRYGNVKITCEKYNIPLYNNLDEYLNKFTK